MNEEALQLSKVTPACGAEVSGIDLSRTIEQSTITALKVALAEHGVLFFRDQRLTPEQQKAIGYCFGDLHLHPAWPRLVDGHPEVMEIFTDENSTYVAGEDWHADVSCDAEPPMGTILYMLEVPPVGGDTLFANMYAVFESLSDSIQRFLEGMTAVHDGENHYRGRYGGDNDAAKVYPKSRHPVVCTHPISGRKFLFVNRLFTTRIAELEKQESDAILRLLFEQIERPEYQCRFQWQAGSVAFWENRCAQHMAIWDYYPHRRRGWRVTIKGCSLGAADPATPNASKAS